VFRPALERLEDRTLLDAGALDLTFGTNGKVITDFGGTEGRDNVALQADGKIVVAGCTASSSGFQAVLARYLPSGALDPSFGTGGKVFTGLVNSTPRFNSVAIQADGRIVAAGSTGSTGADFLVARYLPNGTLDPSFGTGGKATADFGAIDEAFSVAIQADGRIVAAGTSFNQDPFNIEFALARFLPNGSLDSDFDADGKVLTAIGNDSQAFGVAIQADRKIVAAGTSGNSNFALVRYLPDGSLDASFGTGGKVTTAIGVGFEGVGSMALQADGKIVVVGSGSGSRDTDFALVRYLPNGVLDPGFGTGGKVTTDFGANEEAFGVTIQANGKIVVAGETVAGNIGDFALARYLPNGSLDSSFSFDGKVATDFGGEDLVFGVALQADGNIVAAGITFDSNDQGNFALARYLGDPVVPDIQVLNGTTVIPDNAGSVNFGTVVQPIGTSTRTFTVRNIGVKNLTLGPTITVPAGFSLVAGFGSTTLAPGASTTFTVRLGGATLGLISGQVSFATNDPDDNPFKFTVSGFGSSLGGLPPAIRDVSLTRQVNEGGTVTLRGRLTDPDPREQQLSLVVDWGDGTLPEVHAVGRQPFAIRHVYLNNPSGTGSDDFTVSFTWFNSHFAANSETRTVTVHNVPPQLRQVTITSPSSAGGIATLRGLIDDVGVLDSHTLVVDWGDGSGDVYVYGAGTISFAETHTYRRPGHYVVRLRLSDNDGGIVTKSLHLTVPRISG
jgi:uncharacterized delta-60 repeat protein